MARPKKNATPPRQIETIEDEPTTTKLNKSEQIRNYQAEHPEAKPKVVADELNRLFPNANFTAQMVSMLKSKNKQTGATSNKPTKTAHSSNGSLDAALNLIEQCGSLAKAQELLLRLSKIR